MVRADSSAGNIGAFIYVLILCFLALPANDTWGIWGWWAVFYQCCFLTCFDSSFGLYYKHSCFLTQEREHPFLGPRRCCSDSYSC
ncbi:hypothetical protein B0T16DRAFT_27620 [Cercophora newfieldiana]|uniref:Uncharacterized protein n=1 Tax=Cercophora newfieldiana TaxID=92897 RepID=A0AA39YP08_9PEZI|nr:hypothetical protein B0T16DRAFT_27620 [Cercophora newfieldiana]